MTAYIEYELHCDGEPGMGPFDCITPAAFDSSVREARRAVRAAGWKTMIRNGKLVDLCPDHQGDGKDGERP